VKDQSYKLIITCLPLEAKLPQNMSPVSSNIKLRKMWISSMCLIDYFQLRFYI